MTITEDFQVTTAVQPAHVADSRWTAARAHLRDRRSERAAYKAAERELSTYTTPADIQELDAMLERSEGDSVYAELIERIRFRAA